ncbi:YdgA family protein [Pleomorphomonas sp. JP5]|uniref:YdgA family protein n=1 Tax=Pleomorphomonas sp. JP5 TaxID=2942998 RepID=UPI0020438120|nr:YdgA family protein [Pleomorphomonas sp. JP5]MCM5556990.1 YdgA family protein [Pleomorphomonas sp. JP5]
MRKLLSIVLVIVIASAVTLGWRWYSYVSNTDGPYDEVGIELNSRMPLPLRKWGCDRLKATFGAVLPPYGCSAEDGKSWIE